MPTIPIIFLDREDQPTNDTVIGTPNVHVTVAIGGQDVISGQPAIVDIGADFCIISVDELALIGDVIQPANNPEVPHPYLIGARYYEGTITIHGLDGPVATYFTPKQMRPRVLIGRHVLRNYNMTYNPLAGVFTLEKPDDG
jgi:hypothetical protein